MRTLSPPETAKGRFTCQYSGLKGEQGAGETVVGDGYVTTKELLLTLTIQPGAFCVQPITRSVLIMPVSGSIDRSRTLFCVEVSVARAKKRGKGSAHSAESRQGA